MNHTQTAQAALAAHAAGQVPEVTAEQQPQQQTIQIGFEKALTMMNPEWRTALSPEMVNQFRHFYHRGVQDISFLIQMSNTNMQQNLDAVMHTVIVTGNEEQIAQLQKNAQEAAAAAEEATKKPRRTAKAHKAPAAKPKAAARTATKAAPVKATGKKAKK